MALCVSCSVRSVSKGSTVCFPAGSRVGDLVQHVLGDQGFPSEDFYVTTDGRVSGPTEPLLQGAVYRLEPRLCGGKGGFGSMLRALGAQIEKTTNREACRDLSGRRLRDVNHEKEMAEWLKKQAELEGEKDQRRLERLQRKLQEPKHHFTDTDYQQQCHDLSERLEDSVLKGMQASSRVLSEEAGPSTKRANQQPVPVPRKKKCFWTGGGDLDMLDSEEEDGDDDEERPGPSHQTRSSAEPVSTGSDHAEPEPVSTGSDQPEPEPVSTGSDQAEPEPVSTGTDQAEPEPVSTGSDQAEPEPVSTGSDQAEPEPVPTGSDQAEPEPVSTGSDQPEPEPVSTGSDQPEPVSTGSDQPKPEPVSTGSDQPQPELVTPQVDVDSVGSPEDLEVLGLARLKDELVSRGCKCGGTLKERAARLYSVRGLRPEQIDPLLRAKTSAKDKKKK